MLTPEMKKQLLEAAQNWADAESASALQIECGWGKWGTAEQAAKSAKEEFKKLLDQA